MRKLLPESWGFFCPVHTPDGSPCGLLNHLTADARVVSYEPRDAARVERALSTVRRIWHLGGCSRWFSNTRAELVQLCKHRPGCVQVLKELGMKAGPSAKASAPDKSLSVMLDGKVLGTIPRSIAGAVVSHIRGLKAASYARFTKAIPGLHARPGSLLASYSSALVKGCA